MQGRLARELWQLARLVMVQPKVWIATGAAAGQTLAAHGHVLVALDATRSARYNEPGEGYTEARSSFDMGTYRHV